MFTLILQPFIIILLINRKQHKHDSTFDYSAYPNVLGLFHGSLNLSHLINDPHYDNNNSKKESSIDTEIFYTNNLVCSSVVIFGGVGKLCVLI